MAFSSRIWAEWREISNTNVMQEKLETENKTKWKIPSDQSDIFKIIISYLYLLDQVPFLWDLNKIVTILINMSDIDGTKVKFFGPPPKCYARRAGNFFWYRAEFEQNNSVRAEFRVEYGIFISTADRQNKPFFEQNLSKPTPSRPYNVSADFGWYFLNLYALDGCSFWSPLYHLDIDTIDDGTLEVIFLSIGLENLYGMIAYCQDVRTCRRALIGRHFGERWKTSECREMCDNCKRVEDQPDGKRDASVRIFYFLPWPLVNFY